MTKLTQGHEVVDGDELAATNWSSEPWRGPDREEVEAEDVEELVVRGTVVDVGDEDDDEELGVPRR